MTPEAFVSKWKESTTLERAAAQEHFIDLCRLLGEKTPHEADPAGEWYAFEKGVQKTGAGKGWADVWRRGCFGWEYKGKGKDLGAALKQLQLYALALESPPLLIVCDLDSIEIHTAFQNAVQEVHRIGLADLLDPQKRQLLKWAFSEPERLKPEKTRSQITEDAAGQFANLAFQLRQAGHEPHVVAHFLNKLLFCMFAEDSGLLPKNLFAKLLENGVKAPEHFDATLKQLFQAMGEGGPFGVDMVSWFNGGLFNDDTTLPLTGAQVRLVLQMAYMDWSQIEPSIFGTLFERGLDPDKRSQLGAHYTDPGSIMRLVNPTIVEPLQAEWEATKKEIVRLLDQAKKVKSSSAKRNNERRAEQKLQEYLQRLGAFRVLDPACGSGNFLYLALRALKDLEHRTNVEAEALGLHRGFPMVSPDCVHGIEVNAYAAELARVTVWIGEIQWMLQHGYSLATNPILKPLDHIEERDAVLDSAGSEPAWPVADVIIGNPPFLGSQKMLRELGEKYVHSLRDLYSDRLPGGVDFVVYWYEKSLAQVVAGRAGRVGLVATNSIRGGRNRKVINRIQESCTIFNAWSDEPWVNEGAAVRVSLICFGRDLPDAPATLNGEPVAAINPDLTPIQAIDVTAAKPLSDNQGIIFQGMKFVGGFDVPGELARQWLNLPANPNGRKNADVLRPWLNGSDITKRWSDKWIIDFGTELTEAEAAYYEAPFRHLEKEVKSKRVDSRSGKGIDWWRFVRPRPAMRRALAPLHRYIATNEIAKHRTFTFVDARIWPSGSVYAIAREDLVTFGILHSKFHELWALRMGTSLEDRPRYTPSSTFETYPFPEGLSLDLDDRQRLAHPKAAAITEAASELLTAREQWLNPPEWVDRVPEVVPGYPDRKVPKKEHETKVRKRTLTNLYNERPTWLDNAHRKLDEAVQSAYGWPEVVTDDQILKKLLEMNLSRSCEA